MSFVPKIFFQRKRAFPNGIWTRFTKTLVHENVFNQYLNLFPKNLGLQKQNGFKMNLELGLHEFQKLIWETSFLQKTNLIMQNCLHHFHQNSFLHLKGFMQTAFQKKPFFQNLYWKSFFTKPDALKHVEPPMKSLNLR